MRNLFLGHFKEAEQSLSVIWQTANFVFDANVLLNLYRYSDDTRNDFMSLLDRHKERSWLPEQVAYEFLKNRASVISTQLRSYASAVRNIEDLQNSFSGSKGHPFITKEIKKAFDLSVDSVKIELEKNKENQERLIHADPIKEKIADLFEGRVGLSYCTDKMQEIFEEGTRRYEARIPPGYKDGGKFSDPKNDDEKRAKFGDLIVWKQIIDHANSTKRPIIFVTDDKKEDWWEEHSGKTLGPRPEMVKEFFENSKQKILFLTNDHFLTEVKERLKTPISLSALKEIQEEQHFREEEHEKVLEANWLNFEIDEQERARRFLRFTEDSESIRSRATPQDRLRRMEALSNIHKEIEQSKFRSIFLKELEELELHRDALIHELDHLKHEQNKSNQKYKPKNSRSPEIYMSSTLRQLEALESRIAEMKFKLNQIE